MNHLVIERIKAIAICVLLVLSLVQVGILWGNQSHGLPFKFLDPFFSLFGKPQSTVDDQMTSDNLFTPYRLAVSNGDSSHWILERKNKYFKGFWEEAKKHLNEICDGSLKHSPEAALNWSDITKKRGIFVEFKSGIRPDLLTWFLGKSSNIQNIPSVYKMMIVPDSTNENTGILYIRDADGSVSAYTIDREESFEEIITAIESNDNGMYQEYTSMGDSNLSDNSEPDVLYILNQENLDTYSTLSYSTPDSFGRKDDELANVILGSGKDRYTRTVSGDGTIQFSNTGNIYKIRKDGLMEYDYYQNTEASEKASVGAALLNAYSFISRLEPLINKKAAIMLSDTKGNNDGSFTFSFDYYINDLQIYVNLNEEGGKTADQHAIVITSNNKRVLGCTWLFRDFTNTGSGKYYNALFNYGDKIPNIKSMKIKDITIGYVINSLEGKALEPEMVIEKANGAGIQSIDLLKQYGG